MRTGVGETAGGRRALGELASGARAVAAALRARGIPEDVEVAAFLERLAGAARMHLAGGAAQFDMFDPAMAGSAALDDARAGMGG
jgi:hypothetical protein